MRRLIALALALPPEIKAADPTLDFVCEWKPS